MPESSISKCQTLHQQQETLNVMNSEDSSMNTFLPMSSATVPMETNSPFHHVTGANLPLFSCAMKPPFDLSNVMVTPPPDDKTPQRITAVASLSTLLSHFPDIPKYLSHAQFGHFVNYWYTFQYCIALARFDHCRPMVIQEMNTLVSHLHQLVHTIIYHQQLQHHHENKEEDLEEQTPFMISAIQTLKDRVHNVIQVFQVIETNRVINTTNQDPMSAIMPIVQRVLKRREVLAQQHEKESKQQQQQQRSFLSQQQYQPPTSASQYQEQQQQDLNTLIPTPNMMMVVADNDLNGNLATNNFMQHCFDNNNNTLCIQPTELMQLPNQQQQQQHFDFSSEPSNTTMLPAQQQQLVTGYHPSCNSFTSNVTPANQFSALPATNTTMIPSPISVIVEPKQDQTVESLSKSVVDISLKDCKVKENDSNNKEEEGEDEEKNHIVEKHQDIIGSSSHSSFGSVISSNEEQQHDIDVEYDDSEYDNDDDKDEDYFEDEYGMVTEEDDDMIDLDLDDDDDVVDDEDDGDYIDGSTLKMRRRSNSNNNKKARSGRPSKKQSTNDSTYKKSASSNNVNNNVKKPSFQHQHQHQQQRRTRAPRQYTRRTATSYDADTTHYLKSVFFSIYSKRDKLTKEQRKQVQLHTGLKPRNITYWFSNHKRRFQNSLQVFKQAVRESHGKIKTYDDFLLWRRKKGLPEDVLDSEMTASEHLFTNNRQSHSNEEDGVDENMEKIGKSLTHHLPSPPDTERTDSDNNSITSSILNNAITFNSHT
ncbi:hypothetical protein BDA99DRAFT_529067 [Phascolomyces articulosus]|uniref:Homeobox domain-containing protein n=1 Tax=Phascolomyces articulosus TaxID=60185 RepID=A0AAD5JLJ5_9FUNG|nr:hypothetical protein BDA99DRAFT_529067 [Phascolomyces articulosus]